MKRTIDIILYSVAGVLLLAITVIGIAGSRRQASHTKCRGVKVELTDSSKNSFVSADQVRAIIDKEYGGYRNVPMGDISLTRIEDILERHGMMQVHEAYFTKDAVLHIMVKQYTPVLKMKSEEGLWYLCRGGRWFRVGKGKDWCADIPVMSGAARSDNPQWMREACGLGEFIAERESLRTEIEGLSCDRKGEISLKLSGRNETFIIGRPTQLKDKFSRIDKYKEIMRREESAAPAYRSVNVKYDRQIVCK